MINTNCEWYVGHHQCCGEPAVAIVQFGITTFQPMCYRHIVEAGVDPDGDRIWQLTEPIRLCGSASLRDAALAEQHA